METRDIIRLVGRRTVLRYAMAGFVAAAVSACSRDGGSTDVRFRTLGAFLEGSWEFEAENGAGARIAVSKEGDWLMTGGGVDSPWSEEGTWALDSGRLSVTMTGRRPHVVQDVPDDVEKALAGAYTVSGGLTDDQDRGYRRMRVGRAEGKVMLTFPDERADGRIRVVTCTRVKTAEAP
ncbi:hypothetical protein ACIBO4_35040 [Streptomyces sp. NPDC050149]|uniref:hypothetical protein n=1 Tax=Streptomyces sp. NPDC050149 TaxID=3365603 RepID=UPI0037B7D25F